MKVLINKVLSLILFTRLCFTATAAVKHRLIKQNDLQKNYVLTPGNNLLRNVAGFDAHRVTKVRIATELFTVMILHAQPEQIYYLILK
jgi:hypothetical protein